MKLWKLLAATATAAVLLATPAIAQTRIALVVKSLGNGFFDAANQGAQDAAEELGDVEVIYTGPTSATAEAQIEVVNSLIAQQVDAIAISANDPDALVPVSAATAIAERCADQHCEVMAGCGHLPFVSRAADFLACCQRFFERSGLLGESALQREQHWLSDRQFKRDVARSFSRAAQSYDSVAELQRRVADRLLASLPDCRDKRLVDLGCGTGYSLPALAERAYVSLRPMCEYLNRAVNFEA